MVLFYFFLPLCHKGGQTGQQQNNQKDTPHETMASLLQEVHALRKQVTEQDMKERNLSKHKEESNAIREMIGKVRKMKQDLLEAISKGRFPELGRNLNCTMHIRLLRLILF